MLTFSKYNHYYKNEKGILVFNSISKKILIVNDEKELEEARTDSPANSKAQSFLLKNNFLVNSGIDENAVARFSELEGKASNDLSIMILPTTACNFKCVYCYEQYKPLTMSEEVKKRLKLYLRRSIPSFRSVHIDWFGGEPLLMKDLIYDISETVENICKQSGRRFIASITTNGLLLDAETFRNLLRHHVYTYAITIDGTKHIHDRLRVCKDGQGSFDRIISNLLEIKSKIKEKYFTILIRVNVTKPLLEEFDDYLQYMSELFGQDSRFTFMFRVVGDYGGDDIDPIRQELLGEPDVVYEYLNKSNVSLDYRGHYSLLTNASCAAAKLNAYTIFVDGSIYKCPSMLGDDRACIGSLGHNGEFNVDSIKLSQWIGANENKKECSICEFQPLCNNCPAKRFSNGKVGSCIMNNGRLDKQLELLTKSGETHQYEFLYRLEEGEIFPC